MSLLVFHHCICDFPCSCHSFNPNSCICHHFICLTDCMSLFRGHVTCWNSTLTGPWAGSHCFTSTELKQRRQRLQRERQKSKCLDWQNNSSACASRFFVHFFEVTAQLPNFTFCGGREHKTMTFFFFSRTLIQSFRIQLQRKLLTFHGLNEME